MNLTLEERERLAYIRGDTQQASTLADFSEALATAETAQEDSEDLREKMYEDEEVLTGVRDAIRELATALQSGEPIRSKKKQNELAGILRRFADDLNPDTLDREVWDLIT